MQIKMSHHIPFEIQVEIIQKLPIKSLLKLKSVSNPWKSLICSSKFIFNYHVIHLTQPQDHHLLIRYTGSADDNSVKRYVLIADDDVTFPQQKSLVTVPMPVKLLNQPTIISSQGLLCLYWPKACTITKDDRKTVVIWNPTVGKSVCIDVPNVLDSPYETVIGFGVRPDTCDPMLVKVTFDSTSLDTDTFIELFTLSTHACRKLSTNLPRKEIIYDLNISLHISKLSGSLVVVQTKREAVRKPVYTVWKIMEHGVKKLFTELITTYTPDSLRDIIRLHGFRKIGEPIIEIINGLGEDALFVYEPNSKKRSSIGITGKQNSCSVNSYTESLLLFDY
ncbi:putative F-box domain-containing protein [Tanacetum coccineum]